MTKALTGIYLVAFMVALLIITDIYKKKDQPLGVGDWIIIVILSSILAFFLSFLMFFAICSVM